MGVRTDRGRWRCYAHECLFEVVERINAIDLHLNVVVHSPLLGRHRVIGESSPPAARRRACAFALPLDWPPPPALARVDLLRRCLREAGPLPEVVHPARRPVQPTQRLGLDCADPLTCSRELRKCRLAPAATPGALPSVHAFPEHSSPLSSPSRSPQSGQEHRQSNPSKRMFDVEANLNVRRDSLGPAEPAVDPSEDLQPPVGVSKV